MPTSAPFRLQGRLAAVRRAVLLRRRLLAALFTAAAVATGLQTAAGPPPPSGWVVTARHDLAAGVVLSADDLTRSAVPTDLVPSGALPLIDLEGRVLAAPLRAGEPVTDVRVVAPSLLQGYDGRLALPVRIPDPDAVGLLRVGDRIDLLATDPQGGGSEWVATDVPVLALPASGDSSGGWAASGSLGGRLVLLGATAAEARVLADSAVRSVLTVAFSD